VQLESLPCPVELPRLFQVDLVKPAGQATLGKRITEDILQGINVLHRLSRVPSRRQSKEILRRLRRTVWRPRGFVDRSPR
jgi:hypothetical protein